MDTYLIYGGDPKNVTDWVCPQGVPGALSHNVTHHLISRRATGVMFCAYCRRTEGDLHAEQFAIIRTLTDKEDTTVPTRTTSIVITSPAAKDLNHERAVKETVERIAASLAYFGVVPNGGGDVTVGDETLGTFTIVTSTTE